MLKQEQTKVEDSNMALVGTQADKDARKGAAMTEAAWKGAGDEVGIQIWRVENKVPKPLFCPASLPPPRVSLRG